MVAGTVPARARVSTRAGSACSTRPAHEVPGLPCRHGRWTLGEREGGGMRRVAITLALGLLCCLVAIMAQAQAPAHDQRHRPHRSPVGPGGGHRQVPARRHRRHGQRPQRSPRRRGAGSGWWRLQPQAATGRRLLLVYHPYSARLTVGAAGLPRRNAERVRPRPGCGLFAARAGVTFPATATDLYRRRSARYPLQVAVRDIGSHAVSDRSHSRVLYIAPAY